MQSKIIIDEDFESIKSEILANNDPNFVKIFECDTLLMEDAKEIIKEAYIAEIREKVIVIIAHKFGIDPQNALLKILEEPPRNIVFVIVAKSKNLLLPTIRSRLVMDSRVKKSIKIDIGLNLKRLELKEIYLFIEEKVALEKSDKFGKKELLAVVKQIILDAITAGIKFESEDYEYFCKIYRLIDLNAKSASVLTPLLLLLMQRTR
ncbi:DNA polymerase III subunit delta' [Campylobacter hyointestinalis]|uniref:DNA polymerase III subunit delta' n=1 Tax=Campylobacter hyointestinalis TaxID=198 RepID=UPI000DCBD90B|nr:DNA polymerase III subunit delta' [Campylobacter hyointestinalis]RAZ23704.1 DNA polymerase III subunit delta' [Campylobacter hyointestinalis subsp. lawsonii]RAZ38104.1 DNA polymerase III subunit delta' [Campylobacter hyointestinalis subsp. lawsonii]RAZ49292.1 DNA polymerase III subunit delta' [Campylobacter hyointestinalis subsp. lawsonii]RAZ60212.1 DNA polymerase III subunit delta' [Campylobacter hyointestinalis subsp. lawsonii]